MGKLSIVATPIGNLEDITLRALRTLKECNVIYAEDTRVISKLLARYEIQKPLARLDAATEIKKADEVIERLEAGENVAFVSDAGTPGVSDPGSRLVAHVRERLPDVKIEAIPGPSALREIAASARPVILFESPHRILKLLTELHEVLPASHVVIGRELTKMHEEVVQGAPAEVAESLEKRGAVRGEFVVIIENSH